MVEMAAFIILSAKPIHLTQNTYKYIVVPNGWQKSSEQITLACWSSGIILTFRVEEVPV